MYTDDRTAAYESRVALFGRQAMAGREVLNGALSLEVVATMPIPRSWPKRRQAAALEGIEQPTGKPDADNVLKALCDGLNGIVWHDDAQIVDMRIVKRYGIDPGAVLTVRAAL